MQKGSLRVLVGVAFGIVLSCAPSGRQERTAPSVALLKLGTHPVIDTVTAACIRELVRLSGDGSVVRVHNANFDFAALNTLARQIVQTRPAVVIPITTPASQAAVAASAGRIPVVFGFASDTAALGYRGHGPPPNTTGVSDQVNYSASLDLVRICVPRARRIGYLLTTAEPNAVMIRDAFVAAAAGKDLVIETGMITDEGDIRAVTERLMRRADCLLVGGDNTVAAHIEVVLDVARRRDVPVFACDEVTVARGAVAGIGVDYAQLGVATGEVAWAVATGRPTSTIPVRVFLADRLFINPVAARRAGVSVPDSAKGLAAAVMLVGQAR